MFTVLFALVGMLVFVLTLLFSKFNFKKATLGAITCVLIGLLFDVLISGYLISLSNLIY